MHRAAVLVACAILTSCRQATPAEVGAQSIRDAQPMAIIQASQHAASVSPTTIPESAKGGAVQQAPSRLR